MASPKNENPAVAIKELILKDQNENNSTPKPSSKKPIFNLKELKKDASSLPKEDDIVPNEPAVLEEANPAKSNFPPPVADIPLVELSMPELKELVAKKEYATVNQHMEAGTAWVVPASIFEQTLENAKVIKEVYGLVNTFAQTLIPLVSDEKNRKQMVEYFDHTDPYFMASGNLRRELQPIMFSWNLTDMPFVQMLCSLPYQKILELDIKKLAIVLQAVDVDIKPLLSFIQEIKVGEYLQKFHAPPVDENSAK